MASKTTAPHETVEAIRVMTLDGKSGREIARLLGLDHRRVSKIITEVLRIVRPSRKKTATQSEALARPVEPTKWEEMRRAERIVPDYIPHITATMGGRYVPKELDYRGRRT